MFTLGSAQIDLISLSFIKANLGINVILSAVEVLFGQQWIFDRAQTDIAVNRYYRSHFLNNPHF